MPYDDNIDKVFAKNLRRHCENQPSIAAICAATKINRQQFNKYLSGKVLPGSRNLRKICLFLGVHEEELFKRKSSSNSAAGATGRQPKLNARVATALLGLEFADEGLDFQSPGLEEGFYYCYFPLVDRTRTLLRSLVWVHRKNRQTHFVRVTSVLGRSNLSSKRIRGRHSGIVFSSAADIFMLAFNRYAKGQLTVAVFHHSNYGSGGDLRVGRSLTRSPEGMRCMWSVLAPIAAGTPVRTMLKSVGVCAEDDPSVDVGVRVAFPDQRFL